jgi:hypothetical protein
MFVGKSLFWIMQCVHIAHWDFWRIEARSPPRMPDIERSPCVHTPTQFDHSSRSTVMYLSVISERSWVFSPFNLFAEVQIPFMLSSSIDSYLTLLNYRPGSVISTIWTANGAFLIFQSPARINREPGRSVSIVSGYGLDEGAIEVRSPAEAKGFCL